MAINIIKHHLSIRTEDLSSLAVIEALLDNKSIKGGLFNIVNKFPGFYSGSNFSDFEFVLKNTQVDFNYKDESGETIIDIIFRIVFRKCEDSAPQLIKLLTNSGADLHVLKDTCISSFTKMIKEANNEDDKIYFRYVQSLTEKAIQTELATRKNVIRQTLAPSDPKQEQILIPDLADIVCDYS